MSNATPRKLPALPEDITAQWLGSRLGHEIESISNTRSIWGTGSKLFYTITYKNESHEERPQTVCVKGVFDPEMMEAQPWTVSLAQREAEFFSKIAPSLRSSANTMIFPRGWWSGTSEQQGIVVMEDLTQSGCTFAPEVASYPVGRVLDAVEQLASLHARYWGQSEADHPWIWNNYDPALRFLCASWNDIVRLPGRTRLPDYLTDGLRCNSALDKYFTTRNPAFRTLLHGDTHIGNVYFTATGRVGFLDLSAIHFGSCFHDVVYHVTSMLTVEDRRAHEMEILDRYLDALHRFGGPRFDRHTDPDVMTEYRRSFMSNVVWLICPEGLQSKERIAVLCERTIAAYDDHKVLDVILDQSNPTS